MILLILLDGSPFLIIGNFIEGIIFIMIILPPTTRNVEKLYSIITSGYEHQVLLTPHK